MLLWFAYLLLGTKGTHYDNFSHWMLVVREILKDDRMPTSANELMIFSAYPLGSALWIYYVCRVVGLGESLYLFANQIMALSLLLPTAAWVTRKKWANAILAAGYVLYALTVNNTITDLLVDTMLATAAVALFAVGIYYEKDLKRAVLCAAPMLVFLTQLKNSGIFFVALYLVWFGFLHRKELRSDRSMGKKFLGWNVLLPLGSLLIWQKHVKLVYTDGMLTLHAMSFGNYKNNLGERSFSYIRGLLSNVFTTGLSSKSGAFTLLLILTAALVAFMLIQRPDESKVRQWLAQIGANWGIYLLYLAGVWAMYVLSMSTYEAEHLASFGRYLNTCGIFLYGITVIFLMRNVEFTTKSWYAAVLCVIMTVGICQNIPSSRWKTLEKRMVYEGTQRAVVQDCIQNMEKGRRYFVYSTDRDDGYMSLLLRYEWDSNTLSMNDTIPKTETLENICDQADYLFIWTPDETSDAFLRENGLEEFCGEKGAAIDLRYMTK